MQFSKTTQYALRTLTFMSRSPEEPFSSLAMHRELGIPRKYLQRLLTGLAKHRLIRSIRGRSGGYMLARGLRAITLADVVDAVEGLDLTPRCFFGFEACAVDRPCTLHARWVRHQRSLVRTLTGTTLADVVSRHRRAR